MTLLCLQYANLLKTRQVIANAIQDRVSDDDFKARFGKFLPSSLPVDQVGNSDGVLPNETKLIWGDDDNCHRPYGTHSLRSGALKRVDVGNPADLCTARGGHRYPTNDATKMGPKRGPILVAWW